MDRAPLTDTGTFELVAEEPGVYFLMLSDDEIFIFCELRMEAGAQHWETGLALATLSGNFAIGAATDERIVLYLSEGDHGITVARRLAVDSDGNLDPTRVPAGRGRLIAAEMPPPSRDPREWPALLELDLALGEERRVSVDR